MAAPNIEIAIIKSMVSFMASAREMSEEVPRHLELTGCLALLERQ